MGNWGCIMAKHTTHCACVLSGSNPASGQLVNATKQKETQVYTWVSY